MKLTDYIQTIRKIDDLIARECTGAPSKLGRKLGLSDRQVRTYLDEMRAHGASISYSRKDQTYRYDTPGKFCLDFSFKHE